MSSTAFHIFPIDQLRDFTTRVFLHYGMSDADAQQAAEVLATSDLRGIDSHGVARLRAYSRAFETGDVNPRPNITIVRQTPSTATVDGDRGLGLVVGPHANRIAIEKAAEVGTGWVAVRNSSHYGIAGYYPLAALEHDLIGWSMTNGTPNTVPLWGAERRLSTNPIAIAFPGDKEPPIVIDMATSAVPVGKVEIVRRRGGTCPEGWLIDADGRTSTNPDDLFNGGALLPLGGDRDHSGHKGYCLASMVDLLCGVLSGANWGPFVPAFVLTDKSIKEQTGVGTGHFFGAMQIAAFIDVAEFKQRVDHWIRTMRATKPAVGTNGPLIPGDPERIAVAERSETGVPLATAVVDDLRAVAELTGVALD
jgi:LDH2 family malate/lactate/ureidoglycolate dehydrogenase